MRWPLWFGRLLCRWRDYHPWEQEWVLTDEPFHRRRLVMRCTRCAAVVAWLPRRFDGTTPAA